MTYILKIVRTMRFGNHSLEKRYLSWLFITACCHRNKKQIFFGNPLGGHFFRQNPSLDIMPIKKSCEQICSNCFIVMILFFLWLPN